ncbi:MAG: hypothetical protein O9332_01110 [Microcystis sp. LE19-10.1B]|uniref:hypothetical protein n=1 Tax=Microcystis sp. LE19-10.1B TaxID=3016428 RepID=UPI0022CC45F0|nr:hypothetical protein [Microcystis sp. LE19-10.1B]MCZ8024104.1 hypothetical protein [Microcystis sp. LE19-10.1B]MCZ8363661.1 hypothetical protein [Microcystis sp. LE19-251.1A]
MKKSIVKWMLTALLTTVFVTFAYGLVTNVLAQTPSPTPSVTPSSKTPSPTPAPTSSPQIPSRTAAATSSPQTQSGTPAKFSDQALAIAIALGGVLGFYTITVLWVSWDNNYNFRELWIKPVALTAGHLGKASLSNFQIFGFTLVVLFRLLYTLSNEKELSGLSNDILLLLGISAVGTTGSKVIALGSKRLTFSNWAWLRNHQWLTIGEKGYEKKPELEDAKWSDLIKSGGSFDVYSFQLAGFSLLVAASLFLGVFGIGSDLATFTLPQNFLSILGLSNVVYLGGKVTDPNSYEELNQKIDELRTEETDLISQYPNIQPESYGKYIAKARIVAEMLRSFYGEKGIFSGNPIDFSKLMPNIPQKDPQFQPAITVLRYLVWFDRGA